MSQILNSETYLAPTILHKALWPCKFWGHGWGRYPTWVSQEQMKLHSEAGSYSSIWRSRAC